MNHTMASSFFCALHKAFSNFFSSALDRECQGLLRLEGIAFRIHNKCVLETYTSSNARIELFEMVHKSPNGSMFP